MRLTPRKLRSIIREEVGRILLEAAPSEPKTIEVEYPPGGTTTRLEYFGTEVGKSISGKPTTTVKMKIYMDGYDYDAGDEDVNLSDVDLWRDPVNNRKDLAGEIVQHVQNVAEDEEDYDYWFLLDDPSGEKGFEAAIIAALEAAKIDLSLAHEDPDLSQGASSRWKQSDRDW